MRYTGYADKYPMTKCKYDWDSTEVGRGEYVRARESD